MKLFRGCSEEANLHTLWRTNADLLSPNTQTSTPSIAPSSLLERTDRAVEVHTMHKSVWLAIRPSIPVITHAARRYVKHSAFTHSSTLQLVSVAAKEQGRT